MPEYQVKLEKFEGPMELLLELIEKENLSITEVSLARVTDQYLEHIKNAREIRLEHLAEFLSVAAKLILIKSRVLLPELTFTGEEEEDIRDLTEKLAEFKKFKSVAAKLSEMDRLGRRMYSRETNYEAGVVFYPPEEVNAFDIQKCFSKILAEIPIISKLEEEIVREVVTLEEKISEMTSVMRDRAEASFSQIVISAKDKIEVIVSFLAMLEMVKQQLISVDQKKLFSDIKLSARE